MASILKNAAAAAVGNNNSTSYYSPNKTNPVLQAMEQETKLFIAYMKKRITPGYKAPNDEPISRAADTLFQLWNKYEPRLPKALYQSKLLEMGDFLVSIKEYNLALWQCYGRYLKSFGDVNVDEITNTEDFKQAFFPSGFDAEDAGFTFRALMGKSISSYQVIRQTDPKLQNPESVDKSIQILKFLRLVTQVILPTESLCWLVYNGTIHMYSISRHLMSLGHSSRVLEFLLWACMCMESSVPLLGVKYLGWRSTLYTAVCQCYYDCNAGHDGEAFARRALSKINELSQLELLSNATESKATEEAFRAATIKMAIMVYKRTVFESRRRPKGLLRPKTRTNLKDAAGLPWPRTQSEKLLVEMFEGSSAQMLALLEALACSNRRTLLSQPPAPDTEVEVLDTYGEVFMSAQEIIAGGGGNQGPINERLTSKLPLPGLGGVTKEQSLMAMAIRGEDGVPLSVVVKLTKLAYCYEQWDTFDTLIENTINAIREVNDPFYGADEKALEILYAYDKVVPRAKHRKLFQAADNEEEEQQQHDSVSIMPPTRERTVGSLSDDDYLIQLAEVLLSIITGPYTQEMMDMDMMVDACLLLWKKCKDVFARFQTGSTDNPKYLQKMDNPSKWVYILDIVHQVLGWCGLSAVDPALTAEVVLRLALVFEASAALDSDKRKSKSAKTALTSLAPGGDHSQPSTPLTTRDTPLSSLREGGEAGSPLSAGAHNLAAGNNAREQLIQAREILELGLQNVSYARSVVARTDGRSIADIDWVKDLNKDLFKPMTKSEHAAFTSSRAPAADSAIDEPELTGDAAAVWNMVRDLHLELTYMYHRICLKLAHIGAGPSRHASKAFKRKPSGGPYGQSGDLNEAYIEDYDELVMYCQRNHVSCSLLLMQRAAMLGGAGSSPSHEQRKLLEDALGHIRKAEQEEKRLYMENTMADQQNEDKPPPRAKIPPPPILLCRTDTSMVFKAAPFEPENGKKVAWYRLFCRSAAGANVKVRLNDYFLPGTGEEVPSFRCELRVSGLVPGEKYVVGVGAYTAEGKLIGDSIGETSRPILASHPMPVLMVWAYLSQTAYQVGHYRISMEATSVLWNHFVARPPPPDHATYTTEIQHDFQLTLHRLNLRVVQQASPVLLRMFLVSLFSSVDINMKEQELFCDKLCDKGSLSKGQIGRLVQCERLLVALELAGWLNEANLALQAVVTCYGLLAPLIHYKIPAVPVIQVLERCCVILQEIPSSLRTKRTQSITDSLHHMTACLTYHMARVLRSWGQRPLASTVNDAARKMLTVPIASEPNTQVGASESKDTTDTSNTHPQSDGPGSLTLVALKKKKQFKGGSKNNDDQPSIGNEELKALEAHMLRLSRQAQGEHDLTGNEEPSILHAYIAYLPSKLAIKEVNKFRKRARYLEFFVQTAQKGLSEGNSDSVLEWCEEMDVWLERRNDMILGKESKKITPGENKKYAASVMEFNKDITPRSKAKSKKQDDSSPKKGKKIRYKPIGITPNMTDAQKQQQEELEIRCVEILMTYFVDLYHSKNKRRKLRRFTQDEMPWRSHLNIVQGLSHFGVFMHKLEAREKLTGSNGDYLHKTSYLDEEWFHLESAGTVVVGWEGGPKHHSQEATGPEATTVNTGRLPPTGNKPLSSIEIAAEAATGKPPPPLYPIPVDDEEDTPRTYRSETDPPPPTNKKKKKDPENQLLTKSEARAILTNTFRYFTRAVVLAHRGQHWTLLQNAARVMWNVAHTALMRAASPDKNGNSFLSVEALRAMVCEPFHMAADCLLDMLVQLQAEKDRSHSRRKKDGEGGEMMMVKSWMGSIKDEKGGANLRFESPLDDVSRVDCFWMRRLVLRVLELLYLEGKWERLVDIALRFNAISDDRYADQVNPLMVQAQRNLVERISAHGGNPAHQPHLDRAKQAMSRGVITPKAYTTLQLDFKVENMEELLKRQPIYTDPTQAQPDIYSGGLYAMRLSSVPLDVEPSLAALRQELDKSQYTSRALRHSRRLMVLYLAGQTSVSEHMPGSLSPSRHRQSHVDFVPYIEKPQLSVPPDMSKEEFLHVDDVQTATLPKGQINIVLSSYDKTIELLLAGNQKGLAAEAMRELGNVQYHVGNMRAAYKWWSESLDTLLGQLDSIHTWRSMFFTDTKNDDTDVCQAMINKYGLWGCLLGGVLASNIAQYVLTSDLGLRTECCFLSGYLFKALLRSSLPHPTADRDYALYEVGEGCEVTSLVPGVDLLSERFRCDGRTLVAALRFVTEELARCRHNLFVLPLITLSQYFTTFVCRDLQRSVDGRILKVRVLTDLGLYHEALITLQQLLLGERLPHIADNSFRRVNTRMTHAKFNAAKPLTELTNLKIMEAVVDKRLSPQLGQLYGPHLTCHTALVHAHLMAAIAETIPVLPEYDDMSPPGASVIVQPHNINAATRAKLARAEHEKAAGAPKIPSLGSLKTMRPVDEDEPEFLDDRHQDSDDDDSGQNKKRFTGNEKPLTLAIIKGTLLSAADSLLATVSEIIVESNLYEKGVDAMTSSELELVVLSKMELASIARQRHHAIMAARLTHSAMKFISRARIFKGKKDAMIPRQASALRKKRVANLGGATADPTGGETRYEYQNFQSRARLDARLWLLTRFALVRSMIGEIQGLGQVKGPEHGVTAELSEARSYCAEGVVEAEAAGDHEMQAEFLMLAAKLNMLQGRGIDSTLAVLDEVERLLVEVRQLSPQGALLRASNRTLQIDLTTAAAPAEPDLEQQTRICQQYIEVQEILLQQLLQLGEKVERHYNGREEYSVPVSPLQNLYLPQLLPLVQVKLRLGHAMARKAFLIISNGPAPATKAATMGSTSVCGEEDDPVSLWKAPLGVLTTALEISKVISERITSVEAELLLHMGKVEHQMFRLGAFSYTVPVNTLLQAINTSYTNDHDLSLIRTAYLEIALVYIWSSGVLFIRPDPPEPPEEVVDDGDTTSEGSASKRRREERAKKAKKAKNEEAKLKSDESIKSKKDELVQSAPLLAAPQEKKAKKGAMSDKDQERKAAWHAIRCAAATGQAQRARMLLVGDSAVTSKGLTNVAAEFLPEFVSLDLLHAYELGPKKPCYKDDIEEEMAPLTEMLDPPPLETYTIEVNKVRAAAASISWTHIMGYQTILQRLCSTSTICAAVTPPLSKNKSDEEKEKDENSPATEFDLDFISHTQADIRQTDRVVRSLLLSEPWALRLAHLHQYLVTQLPAYAQDCCAAPPHKSLLPSEDSCSDVSVVIPDMIITTYSGNNLETDKTGTMDSPPDKPPQLPTNPVVQKSRSLSKPDTTVVENDMVLQWYQPQLEDFRQVPFAPGEEPTVPPTTAPTKDGEDAATGKVPVKQMMLLYSIGRKKEPYRFQCGVMWVSVPQLLGLHDKLVMLTQRGEISLGPDKKEKKESMTKEKTSSDLTKTTSASQKKQARIKALSPRVKRDELLEEMLHSVMEEIHAILGYVPPPPNADGEEEEPPASAAAAAAAAAATPVAAPAAAVEEQTSVATPTTASAAAARKKAAREQPPPEEQKPEFPFDVTRANMYKLERLFDPGFGSSVKEKKMLQWFYLCFP